MNMSPTSALSPRPTKGTRYRWVLSFTGGISECTDRSNEDVSVILAVRTTDTSPEVDDNDGVIGVDAAR